ncbi:MAG: TerC/Alx family metal homeostasis membrane protein [Alphaproteobacteria bacterium]|nr:MAG: TerC/Alx family metal homeostasis membrane protein [Alphaproteobacteria bacterium]
MHLFSSTFWIVFHLCLFGAIGGDLWLTRHTKTKQMPLLLSSLWVLAAFIFGVALIFTHTPETAQIFINGYLIEKSLSIDNIFLFYLVFHKLAIPPEFQHRVLFLGILGALIFRAFFIVAGIALIKKFTWMIPLMGIFLFIMAIKFWRNTESHETTETLNFLKRWLRIHPTVLGPQFMTLDKGKRYLTVTGLSLIYIELSDVIFAFDSVPAVMAFTREIELIYLCNVFSILGLRSLYFVIADISQKFSSVHMGVSLLLGIAGTKMLLSPVIQIPAYLSMSLIMGVIIGCIAIEAHRSWRR